MPDPGDDETPPRRPGPRRKTIQTTLAPSHSFNALLEPSWCGGEMAPVMPAVEGDICGDNILYRGEMEEGGLCSPKTSII